MRNYFLSSCFLNANFCIFFFFHSALSFGWMKIASSGSKAEGERFLHAGDLPTYPLGEHWLV